MKKFTGRKKRVAITTAALVAVGGGAAFAFWTSTGAGDGTASTGSTAPFTVTSTTEPGQPGLAPGSGVKQIVDFEVLNPGTGVQRLNNVEVSVADEDGKLWNDPAGCSYLDYELSPAVFTKGDIAPNGKVQGTVEITMKNLNSNQNGCKGLTVPLHFAAS